MPQRYNITDFEQATILNHVSQSSAVTCWEAHDAEYPVQLVVVEGVAGFDVLLAAVEDGL